MDDGSLVCRQLTDLSTVWTFAGGDIEGTPAVYQGLVYALSRTGKLYVINASQGTLVWNASLASGASGSPLLVDDGSNTRVVVESGASLIAFDAQASATGQSPVVLWSASLTGMPGAMCADANQLYVSVGTSLSALHWADGSVAWSQQTSLGNILYLSCDGSDLMACDGSVVELLTNSQGTSEWSQALDSSQAAGYPVLGPSEVYVNLASGDVEAFDRNPSSSDRLTWEMTNFGPLAAPPSLFAPGLCVPQTDGALTVLDPGSGTVNAEYDLNNDPIEAAVVMEDGGLVVADDAETIALWGFASANIGLGYPTAGQRIDSLTSVPGCQTCNVSFTASVIGPQMASWSLSLQREDQATPLQVTTSTKPVFMDLVGMLQLPDGSWTAQLNESLRGGTTQTAQTQFSVGRAALAYDAPDGLPAGSPDDGGYGVLCHSNGKVYRGFAGTILALDGKGNSLSSFGSLTASILRQDAFGRIWALDSAAGQLHVFDTAGDELSTGLVLPSITHATWTGFDIGADGSLVLCADLPDSATSHLMLFTPQTFTASQTSWPTQATFDSVLPVSASAGVSIGPDHKFYVASGNRLWAYDPTGIRNLAQDGEAYDKRFANQSALDVRFGQAGLMAVLAGSTGPVRFIDPSSGEEFYEVASPKNGFAPGMAVRRIDWSSDGRLAYESDGLAGQVRNPELRLLNTALDILPIAPLSPASVWLNHQAITISAQVSSSSVTLTSWSLSVAPTSATASAQVLISGEDALLTSTALPILPSALPGNGVFQVVLSAVDPYGNSPYAMGYASRGPLQFVAGFGRDEIGGQALSPFGVAGFGNGSVLVSYWNTASLSQFDAQGRLIRRISLPFADNWLLENGPSGTVLAIARNSNATQKVLAFQNDGTALPLAEDPLALANFSGQVIAAAGTSRDGSLLVMEGANASRVERFTTSLSGGSLAFVRLQPVDPGKPATALAAASSQQVYAGFSISGTGSVEVWDTTAFKKITGFGSGLVSVDDLRLDPSGAVYVLDGAGRDLVCYDAQGQTLGNLAGPGVLAGLWGRPCHLGMDAAGHLLVTDGSWDSLSGLNTGVENARVMAFLPQLNLPTVKILAPLSGMLGHSALGVSITATMPELSYWRLSTLASDGSSLLLTGSSQPAVSSLVAWLNPQSIVAGVNFTLNLDAYDLNGQHYSDQVSLTHGAFLPMGTLGAGLLPVSCTAIALRPGTDEAWLLDPAGHCG